MSVRLNVLIFHTSIPFGKWIAFLWGFSDLSTTQSTVHYKHIYYFTLDLLYKHIHTPHVKPA